MPHFIPPTIAELQPHFKSYQLEEILVQGETSAVYSAIHTVLERKVAIKIISPELAQDELFRALYESRAKVLASVQHMSVARVYDFGEVNGMLFTIMEQLSSKSLYDIAYGQKMDTRKAIGKVAAMAKGLHEAHECGILHLNVKPLNILLDESGKGKLIDFKNCLPEADEYCSYHAPETVNRPDLVDQRSDIFSLGVILYELLTSELPGEHLVSASSISGCDPALDTVIAKALHPNPEMRYDTAEEMASELDHLIAQIEQQQVATVAAPSNPLLRQGTTAQTVQPGTAAQTVYSPPGLNSLPKKKKSPVGAVAVGLIAVVAGVIYLAIGGLGGSGKDAQSEETKQPPLITGFSSASETSEDEISNEDLKLKFVAAWRDFDDDGVEWRKLLFEDGEVQLMKDGKKIKSWIGFTWALKDDMVVVMRKNGEHYCDVKLIGDDKVLFRKDECERLALDAAWEPKK